jgi:hypothetical protein
MMSDLFLKAHCCFVNVFGYFKMNISHTGIKIIHADFIIIIIIMALQPFVEPWPLFQFLDPMHSW